MNIYHKLALIFHFFVYTLVYPEIRVTVFYFTIKVSSVAVFCVRDWRTLCLDDSIAAGMINCGISRDGKEFGIHLLLSQLLLF